MGTDQAQIAGNSYQSGFSLVEVLVSVIVLSLGVLGLVGLQATSLQMNREVRNQADGLRLAEELAELMRGNKATSVKLDAAQNPYLINWKAADAALPGNLGCGLPTAASTTCANADMTAEGQSIALRDVYEWTQRVKQKLPGAKVLVCEDATPYDAKGLPQWDCSNTGGVLVLKLGWTKSNTLRGATGVDATDTVTANQGAFDKALRPAILFSVTPGSNA